MSASVVPKDQSWRRAVLLAAMLAGGVEPTHFHADGQPRVRKVASQTTTQDELGAEEVACG